MLIHHARRLLAIFALACAAGTTQAAQTHWYQFNGSLADTQGGPALVANGGTLGAGSYSFGPNQGLSLTGAVSTNVYSIDLTFSFGHTNGTWSKIADFGNLIGDAGWYRFISGGNAMLQLCGCTPQINSTPGAFVDDQSVRVTLTRDAGNLVSQYVNGAFAGSFQDNGGAFAVSQPANVVNFFIDDKATNKGEAASGAVTRIVIFDNALTANEVATLAPVPEPGTFAMLLAGLALVGGVARRRIRANAA